LETGEPQISQDSDEQWFIRHVRKHDVDPDFGSHLLGKPSAHRRIARHRSDSDRATR
jgi:hypothetical protein